MNIKRFIDGILNLFLCGCGIIAFAMLLQVFCCTSFNIPSDSMEPALLAGDRIIVNKLPIGARLFNVFAALRSEVVTIYRLPGIGKIERNNVLVFNFPYPARWDSIGFDVMRYYVKRCVALPGDTFEIRDAQYRVRGRNAPLGNVDYQKEMAKLFALEQEVQRQNIVMKGYPHDSIIDWDIKDFGPLYVPKKGDEIEMNRTNWVLYRTLIQWEQKQTLRVKKGAFFLGNRKITNYRFCKNYYFVAGDKVMNSQDSRYWGLLPEEFIVGKATFIWKSEDIQTAKFRWNRIWKKIE